MRQEKFQGKCYMNLEGHKFMDVFDNMHPWTRMILSGSKYNICAACFQKALNTGMQPSEAVNIFEARIREEERLEVIRCEEAA